MKVTEATETWRW